MLFQFTFLKPKIGIVLWGQGKWNTVGKKERFILKYFFSRKRKFINDCHFATDKELNHVFRHIDALYLDGVSYPYPSGIATRARAFGLPVLVESGPGFYKELAQIDPGIRLGDFTSMSQKEILSEIKKGKSADHVPTVTKEEQIDVFLNIWGN